MSDQHQLAAGHLHAAMALMAECQDTLAVAMIAQALAMVERGVPHGSLSGAANFPFGNRRPC